MHKKTSRHFHIAGTAGDIFWNGDGNRLTITPFDGTPEIHADANYQNAAMFIAQAERFITRWTDEDTNESLEAAAGSLAVVESARCSLHSGCVESIDRNYLTRH